MRASPIFLLFFILVACKPAEEKAFKAPYFDIKGFFEAEVLRLSGNKSAVDKTIEQNGLSETKTGLSIDWENELSLFTGSDINKAAWQDSYKIKEDSSSVSYHAIDPNLRTREIRIIKDINGKPSYIKIKNISRNYLYESSETLIYIPDSVYSIDKNQKVILLGKNSYRINAEIIK